MQKDRYAIPSLRKLRKAGYNHDVGWAGSKSPWTFKIVEKQDIRLDLFSLYSKMSHPALPRILDIKEGDTYFYILKENIHGENLETLIKREGMIEPGKASRIIAGICEALDYLHVLRSGIICYRDIALPDIVLDNQGAAKLINIENLIQIEDDTKREETEDLHQVQSVALLYYHLLTGTNPCEVEGPIQSFSQLGIYLPGELFDIITRALKPGSELKTLSLLRKEIEKVFPLHSGEAPTEKDRSPEKRYITRRQALKIAAVTFAVSAAVMIIINLWVVDGISHKTETRDNEKLLTYQETTMPGREEESQTVSVPEDDVPASAQPPAVPGASDPQPGASDGTPSGSGSPATPEQTADVSDTVPSQTSKNAPSTRKKKVFLSSLKPASFNAGSDSFKLAELDSSDRDIRGGKYQAGIKLELIDSYLTDYSDQWMEVTYNLNGSYSRFSCTFSLSQTGKYIDTAQKAWLNVLGDGQLLVSSASIGSSSDPVQIEVQITGVKKLVLQLNPASQFVENASYLIGNPLLEP